MTVCCFRKDISTARVNRTPAPFSTRFINRPTCMRCSVQHPKFDSILARATVDNPGTFSAGRGTAGDGPSTVLCGGVELSIYPNILEIFHKI